MSYGITRERVRQITKDIPRPPLNAERVCEVDECRSAVKNLGLCTTHYARQRRTGTTDAREPWGQPCERCGEPHPNFSTGYCKGCGASHYDGDRRARAQTQAEGWAKLELSHQHPRAYRREYLEAAARANGHGPSWPQGQALTRLRQIYRTDYQRLYRARRDELLEADV